MMGCEGGEGDRKSGLGSKLSADDFRLPSLMVRGERMFEGGE